GTDDAKTSSARDANPSPEPRGPGPGSSLAGRAVHRGARPPAPHRPGAGRAPEGRRPLRTPPAARAPEGELAPDSPASGHGLTRGHRAQALSVHRRPPADHYQRDA